jgi:hypothetical protein
VIDKSQSPILIYRREDHLMATVTDTTDKTLGQQYYEEVEALKAEGVPNAEAVRQVAAAHDKKENAVRGGLHQYKSRLSGGGDSASPRRSRTAPASVDDLLARARQSLQSAVALIDREVADAKAALDAAQTHYDEVLASVTDRKADVEKKLLALA